MTEPDPERMIARARSLELDTPYVPPPGDPLVHHAAGYAKVMASAVFVTGLDPEFAARNVGYFTAPYEARAKLGKPVIDHAAQAVHVDAPGGITRTARRFGSQGFVTLPLGQDGVSFTPVNVESTLSANDPWPMGDQVEAHVPRALDAGRIAEAVKTAFDPPDQMTASFVVVWKGALVAERYGEGLGAGPPWKAGPWARASPRASWASLIQRGVYELDLPAPIPEWSAPGDPRAAVRIRDILQMSSGLRSKAHLDPDYDPSGTYLDHLYLYTGGVNSCHYAATRPQQWPPGAVGRYRNVDPVLASYLVRLGAGALGEDHLAFPRRSLLDLIGMRTMTMDVDPFGNFLMQGYEQASARDWARLGMLYLQDGVWMDRRILPTGYARFVSSLAPAWAADDNPVYGGLFWINGDEKFPAPREAFYMAGAGGQYTLIIPSHDLVIVRNGQLQGRGGGPRGLRPRRRPGPGCDATQFMTARAGAP